MCLLWNLGPVWRAFCVASMGIDLTVSTVMFHLKEQVDWEKKRQNASSKENLHKRYIFLGESANVDYVYTGTYKRKKAKYEREKVYMESLHDVGNVMGEYAGDAQGDVQANVSVGMESGDADAGVV